MLFATARTGRIRRTIRTTTSLVTRLLVTSLLAASVLTGVAAPGPDPTPPVHDETVSVGDLAAGSSHRIEPRSRAEMVGLTWSAPSVVDFEVRGRSSADGTWSEWLDLHGGLAEAPERAETTDRARFAGPAWLGHDLDAIEVRVGDTPVQGLEAHLVDTEPAQDGALTTPSATALPSQPGIITRAQWGADESWRSVNEDCDQPRYAKNVTYMVIHHTVNANDYSRADAAAIIRGIYQFHVFTNGWCDIAYNFLVDRFGQVFEGRAGGIREAVIGGHSGGFNTNSTGVAMLGDFQVGTVPQATYDSLRKLMAFKLGLHGVNPLGTTVVHTVSHPSSRFPADQDIAVQTVVPHGDLSKTTCPGAYLRQLIPNLRRDVANDIRANSLDRRVVGDWDGDGDDTVGNFENGYWGLRNTTTAGAPDVSIHYGWAGVTPVVGDWDGDGTDTIGVYVDGMWFLRNSNTPGPPDITVSYGMRGYVPVVGDWDGDGRDGIGVYVDGMWYLRQTASPGAPALAFAYGMRGYQPVVGDWDGSGGDGVGVFTDGYHHLRNVPSAGRPDASIWYGSGYDHGVAGDWNGDGTDTIGIYRGAYWYLRNANAPGPTDVLFWF